MPAALPLAATAVLALGGTAPLPSYRPGVVLLRFADPRLSEVSGVAASPYDVGVLFVHNDSGDRARFAAVGTDGTTRAWYRLAGATNVDWEDVAAAPDSQGRPSLWFGDIGDNDRRRAAVVVYRVAAPRLPADPVRATAVAVPWQAYRLVYPDGPHDAEALLVDARTGTLGIVAKTLGPASLYTASLPLRAGTTRLVQAGAVAAGPLVTGGAVSPDGRRVVLRTYLAAREYDVPAGGLAAALAGPGRAVTLPPERQGEAIGYTADAGELLATGEGVGAPVHLLAASPPEPQPPVVPGAAGNVHPLRVPPLGAGPGRLTLAAGGLAAGCLGIAGLAARHTRRRRR